jgi:hypothetical protein
MRRLRADDDMGELQPTGEAGRRYSAAIVCGVKSMPSTFTTPAP